MVGRWWTRGVSSVAILSLNVLHPGRDTLGLLRLLPTFAEGVGAIAGVLVLLWLTLLTIFGTHAFTHFCCKSDPNPPEIELDPMPYQYYRGKMWYKQRKRVPIYHLLKRWGRHSAGRWRNGCR